MPIIPVNKYSDSRSISPPQGDHTEHQRGFEQAGSPSGQYGLFILISAFLFSCAGNISECDTNRFRKLSIYPASCTIKIPEYDIIDSAFIMDGTTILNYRIRARDSSMSMVCFVQENNKNNHFSTDLRIIKEFQRNEVEFNRTEFQQLVDTIFKVKNVSIGYLKYLIPNTKAQFYESRVVFYANGNLITMWIFENVRNSLRATKSLSDCIIETIQFGNL